LEWKEKAELAAVLVVAFAAVIVAPTVIQSATGNAAKWAARCLFNALLIASPFVLSKIFGRRTGSLGFSKERIPKQIAVGVAVAAATIIQLTLGVLALGENKRMLLTTPQRSLGALIAYIAFDMTFIGLGEELLFRGYFLERFQKLTRSAVGGIVWSSVVFGLWHFPGGQDFMQVIITAAIGALYAFSMRKFRNCTTLSVGIAHGLHDVFILILSSALL